MEHMKSSAVSYRPLMERYLTGQGVAFMAALLTSLFVHGGFAGWKPVMFLFSMYGVAPLIYVLLHFTWMVLQSGLQDPSARKLFWPLFWPVMGIFYLQTWLATPYPQ